MRRFHSSTPSPVRSLRRRTDMSFIPCQSRACAIVTTPSSGYADCRIRRKRFPKTRESRSRVQAVVKTALRLVFSVDARCPEVAYEYFFSISAKKGFGEPYEVGFAHFDLLGWFELQHGLVRRELDPRAGRVRPSWELVDL